MIIIATGDFSIKHSILYDLDTSHNFFNDIKRFKYYKTYDPVFVNVSGKILYVIGIREVKITITTIKGKKRQITIIKAFYIPFLHTSVISKDFFRYNGFYFNGKTSVLRWFFNNANYYKIMCKYGISFFEDNVVTNNLKEYDVSLVAIRIWPEILKADL